MMVDVSRNVGKTISLSVFKIKRHFRPLRMSKAAVTSPKINFTIAAYNESASITKTIKSALERPMGSIILYYNSSNFTFSVYFSLNFSSILLTSSTNMGIIPNLLSRLLVTSLGSENITAYLEILPGIVLLTVSRSTILAKFSSISDPRIIRRIV